MDSIDNLEERYNLRTELFEIGLEIFIDKIKNEFLEDDDEIQKEIETLEEEINFDYREMRALVRKKSFLKKISNHGTISITIIIKNKIRNYEYEIQPFTKVSDIIAKIVHEFDVNDPEKYGIVVPASETQKDDIWLHSNDILSECKLNPTELQFEFRMTPWHVQIILPSYCNQSSTDIYIAPQETCGNLLSNLTKSLELPNDVEYCLMINDKPLDDSLSLELSLSDEINEKQFILCELPLLVRIHIGNTDQGKMKFNPNILLCEIFNILKLNTEISNFSAKNYKILLISPDPLDEQKEILVDNHTKLKNIYTDERFILHFIYIGVTYDKNDEIESCNIWDELDDLSNPKDHPNLNITFDPIDSTKTEDITTATLNKLIQRLISTHEYSKFFYLFISTLIQ